MSKTWVALAGIWFGLGAGSVLLAQNMHETAPPMNAGSSRPPSAQPSSRVCTVDADPPSPGETALNWKEYGRAEQLFRDELSQDANNVSAHEGLVRTLIAQDKVLDASTEARGWLTAFSGNSMAMAAVAEVMLRQGDPLGAYEGFQNAAKADQCNARAYFGIAQVDEYSGYHATAKKFIEQAYRLNPTYDDIHTSWISTRPREERTNLWSEYAKRSDQISAADRLKLQGRLDKESLYHPSDCRMLPASPPKATIPMVPLLDLAGFFDAWGLDVQFNGKHRRLQIDTGASGITISREAAKSLGIKREDEMMVGGIGDKGDVKASITHLNSIKIGGVEFTNCAVEILEQWTGIESDGLIGADVFRASAVTLDFPKHEVRLAPLPERPGTPRPTVASADEKEEAPHDPYVAPEMADWIRIFRSGSDLLVRTGIVDAKHAKDGSAWKEKLFLLDSGSYTNMISSSAAHEITRVYSDSHVSIEGISGEVKKVYDAGSFSLSFAGMQMQSASMKSIDMTPIARDEGMEISGIIGASTLFHMVMHIDYRDNLIKLEYKP